MIRPAEFLSLIPPYMDVHPCFVSLLKHTQKQHINFSVWMTVLELTKTEGQFQSRKWAHLLQGETWMRIFKHQRIKQPNLIKSQYKWDVNLFKTLLNFLNIMPLIKLKFFKKRLQENIIPYCQRGKKEENTSQQTSSKSCLLSLVWAWFSTVPCLIYPVMKKDHSYLHSTCSNSSCIFKNI